jgi:hypothetical protein
VLFVMTQEKPVENTVICLLHGETDDRGRLYKAARWKLEEMATALKPFVNSATIWLYDGTREGTSTILSIAPHFGIQVTKEELEEYIDATESQRLEQRKDLPVTWLPSLASESFHGPYRIELRTALAELFAHLANGNSVLSCMSERYFRAFFEFVGGFAYSATLRKGDAVVLEFSPVITATEGGGYQQTASGVPEPDGKQSSLASEKKLLVLQSSKCVTA